MGGLPLRRIPEVKRANYETSTQELVYHDANNAIIVAATHGRIRMCHYNSSSRPFCNILGIVRLEEGIRVVYAAIERRVIVYRRYREAVVGFWRAAHFLGQMGTPQRSSSHSRRVGRLMSSCEGPAGLRRWPSDGAWLRER